MKIITLKNIYKTFKDFRGRKFQALHDIDLEVEEGEFLVLLGPSGCGKSTLLRIMSGLEKKHQGMLIYDKNIKEKNFGFVFQQFALLPWLTVEKNISLGLIAKGEDSSKINTIVKDLILKLGLEKFANEYPKELSGGMKQRVGIARALAIDPKIIFLDEPFSALDSFTAKTLRKELLDIWKERKMTVVMVTHNIEEALELGDRIAVMSPRPGKLDDVRINTLPRPHNLRGKEFFEMVDTIEALVKEQI